MPKKLTTKNDLTFCFVIRDGDRSNTLVNYLYETNWKGSATRVSVMRNILQHLCDYPELLRLPNDADDKNYAEEIRNFAKEHRK